MLDTIVAVWGSRKVGIKICPSDDYNDTTTTYKELSETYSYLIKALMTRNLGYINLSRRGCAVGRDQDDYFKSKPRPQGKELPDGYEPLNEFGAMIKFEGSKTLLMVNHEYTVNEGERLIADGKVDLVSFGRPFIYNPVSVDSNAWWKSLLNNEQDLITRVKKRVPFATNDRGGRVNYGPYKHPNEFYNDWPCAAS